MLQHNGFRKASKLNVCFVTLRNACSRNIFKHSCVKPFSEVPKIKSLPIVGSSWIYLPVIGRYHRLDINHAAWDMHQLYGPLVAEQLPGRSFVVHLFSANDIRNLYQEERKMPYRMGIHPFKLHHTSRPEYFANCGILNAQGEEWLKIRNMGQASTLRPRAVESFVEHVEQVTDDVLELITRLRDQQGNVGGCDQVLKKWSLETIVCVTLGTRLGLLEYKIKPETARIMHDRATFLDCIDTLVAQFPYYRYLPTPTSWRFKRAGDVITPVFFQLTKEAADAARVSKDPCKKSTIIEHLWSKELPFKEMFTFLQDFMFAGINTTSAMAIYTLNCLASNPNAQQQAWLDVVSLPQKGLRKNYVSPFIAACVKEALRLYPILPGVNIKLGHEVIMSDYQIPANIVLRTEQFVAGRLEENFTRASEFLPQRWLRPAQQGNEESATEGETLTMHPFGSLPFGFGPRTCLGKRIAELEVCTLVGKVLERYKVENQRQDIGYRTLLTAKPEGPVKLRFVERTAV